jgi:hypothetical protein
MILAIQISEEITPIRRRREPCLEDDTPRSDGSAFFEFSRSPRFCSLDAMHQTTRSPQTMLLDEGVNQHLRIISSTLVAQV